MITSVCLLNEVDLQILYFFFFVEIARESLIITVTVTDITEEAVHYPAYTPTVHSISDLKKPCRSI